MSKSSDLLDLTPAGIRAPELPFVAAKRAVIAARKVEVTDAAAKVLVLRGYGPHSSAREVNKFLPRGKRLHSSHRLWRLTGGYRRLAERLASGGLFSDAELGGWGEGLVHGLRLSGAVERSRHGGVAHHGVWMVRPVGLRPGLEAVLLASRFPFCGTAKVAGPNLMLYRFWVLNLGVGSDDRLDVLVGLLMGAIPVRLTGEDWLGVPATARARAVLASFGVPVGRKGHLLAPKRRVDLVSPFWGALLGWAMPGGMRDWFLGFERPGMCPLLPWVFLRMAIGKVDGFAEGGVPFLASRGTLLWQGVGLRGVHEAGVRRLGMTRLDPRLRMAWGGHLRSLGMDDSFLA